MFQEGTVETVAVPVSHLNLLVSLLVLQSRVGLYVAAQNPDLFDLFVMVVEILHQKGFAFVVFVKKGRQKLAFQAPWG